MRMRVLVIMVAACAYAAPASAQMASGRVFGWLDAHQMTAKGSFDAVADTSTVSHEEPGKISPKKCLACHAEIGSRIAAGAGYHRDKADDCALCHAEHQGREASIVPLDPSDFDHSETGAVLLGAHLGPKTCDPCHTKPNPVPRSQGRSYLLKTPGCRGCHAPPHPGRQEDCLACHDGKQESWIVGRRPEEN